MTETLIVNRARTADLDVNETKGIVTGLAVPFDTPEIVSDDGQTTYREEWDPAAFTAQLSDPAKIGRIKFLYTHDETDKTNWIGRSVLYRSSAEGLVGEWKVSRDPISQWALGKILDGSVPGLSISARVLETIQRGDVRRRSRAFLEHVAAVEDPAFRGAVIQAIRADRAPKTPKLDKWTTFLDEISKGGPR